MMGCECRDSIGKSERDMIWERSEYGDMNSVGKCPSSSGIKYGSTLRHEPRGGHCQATRQLTDSAESER